MSNVPGSVKVANRLTREIWGRFSEFGTDRANYLRNLISSVIGESALSGERFLDIGGGSGVNASIIGAQFRHIFSLDIYVPDRKATNEKVDFVMGDAIQLPFPSAYFDMITFISSVEHFQERGQALDEGTRVLKNGGYLIIQGPNFSFPLDLHTGLLNPFYLPLPARKMFLKSCGYEWWLDEVFYVSWGEVAKYLSSTCRFIAKKSIIYPESLIPNKMRYLYRLLKTVCVLSIIPLGYVYIFQKQTDG